MFCFSPVPAPSPSGDQERAELAAGRRHLEARQALYAELQTQLDNCPESVREQLQEQLRRVSFTSPRPLPAPEGRPPGREERWAGTAWALQYLPDDRVRVVAWRGQGRVGVGVEVLLSATAGSAARQRGRAERRKGGGVGAGPFLRFPGSSPQKSHLCELAFQAQSGIVSTTRSPLSLSFKEAEALETETKLFEDLEFQQLERESRVEEERELAGQGLLRSKAELLRSIAKRKVRPPGPHPCREARSAGLTSPC